MPPDRREFLKTCALASVAVSMNAAAKPAPVPVDAKSWRTGAARLDVINIGDITGSIGGSMRAPANASEADKRAMAEALSGHRLMPMQDVLVRTPDFTVVVDAGAYDIMPDEPYVVPGYIPPPSLADRLLALGVEPESVKHVVFTHRHFDHINGAVVRRPDGAVGPLFPNARHYIQKADWDYALAKIADLNTRLGRTFSVLKPAGLIEVIEGDFELGPGIRILAAPGETPGHQCVRVESEGQVAYLVGDMIHHAGEVAHPGFMVDWADEVSNLASRRKIYEAAAEESALMIASHIPQAGRFSRIAGQPAWTDLPADQP